MPRKGLAYRRLPPLVTVPLLATAIAIGGCKKNDGETATPGDDGGVASAAEVQAQIDIAKSKAKVAGLVELANEDLEAGRYVAATRLAEEALAENADNADAHAVIGKARWRAGDFEGSTNAYQQALAINPKNFGAALGLANNYQVIAKDAEALAILETLLADDKEEVAPRLARLWSYYALSDADRVVKETDEIFTRIADKDPVLPLVLAYAAYMRPLAGRGPFCQVEGAGKTTLAVDPATGVKTIGTVVGDAYTQAMVTEVFEETLVDPGFAKAAKLESLGKFKPHGSETEVDIVIIPTLKIGELTMKKIPAYVMPLGDFAGSGSETPGIRLGRQALRHIGALTFDFPKFTLEAAASPPATPPPGATVSDLLMLSFHVVHAPIVPIKLEGSEHTFYAYFGGLDVASLLIAKKHYLKSGFLPRHVDPPDDVPRGLKMVYIDGYEIGGDMFPGTGGLVLVNEPPAPVLEQFLRNTAFEIGGFINLNLMQTWRITYALSQSKVYIEP